VTNARKVLRRVWQGSLMAALAGAAAVFVMSPASAQNYGNQVHGCHGIWWNTDWNQECPGGAGETGYYKSTADCKAPQIPDESGTWYRPSGNTTSYDGEDCMYGIHWVQTVYWR
jgi:hypothetical protein